MHTDIEKEASFDHLPGPEELVELYMQSEKDDPRSVFYERILVRPKPPVGLFLLCLAVVAAACYLAHLGLRFVTENTLFVALGAIVAGLLAILLLAKHFLINGVKLYQAWAPYKVRNRCRYEPSCSVYMLQAVEKYGFVKGFTKGLKRWKRCKPPNGGYDLP